MEVCFCWPQPQAMATWWRSSASRQSRRANTMSPSSPTSCWARYGHLYTCDRTITYPLQLEKCLQILLDSNRIPEAAFFARTYLPSEISRIVELWREQLSKVNERAGQSLADPKVFFPQNGSLLILQIQWSRIILICFPTTIQVFKLKLLCPKRETRSYLRRISLKFW